MSKLRGAAARTMRDGFAETLAYTEFRRIAGARLGRATGSSASTARSGGRRGSSGPSRTATRPHAGDGVAEVHSGARAGQEEAPGYVESGRDGRTERKVGGLEEDGAEDSKINLQKNLDGTPSPTFPRKFL